MLNVGAKPRRKRELRDLNEVPEYEKLYEPTSNGLDLASASEIERSSWDITERLVSAFENEETQEYNEKKSIFLTEGGFLWRPSSAAIWARSCALT